METSKLSFDKTKCEGRNYFFELYSKEKYYKRKSFIKKNLKMKQYSLIFRTANLLAKELYKVQSELIAGWNFIEVVANEKLTLGMGVFYQERQGIICIPMYNNKTLRKDPLERGKRFIYEHNSLYGKPFTLKFLRSYFRKFEKISILKDEEKIAEVKKMYESSEAFDGFIWDANKVFTLIQCPKYVKKEGVKGKKFNTKNGKKPFNKSFKKDGNKKPFNKNKSSRPFKSFKKN